MVDQVAVKGILGKFVVKLIRTVEPCEVGFIFRDQKGRWHCPITQHLKVELSCGCMININAWHTLVVLTTK